MGNVWASSCKLKGLPKELTWFPQQENLNHSANSHVSEIVHEV